MIKIEIIMQKNFYFVSNIRTGTVTIIDSLCNSILKEISVGKGPFKLALIDNNTVVVACDISNTISIINCTSGQIREHCIPNNGNLQIDKTNKKIYISNTSEVIIYDINLEKLIGTIKGFTAIIDLRLNREGSKLYVLDTLLKELIIYNTDNYELISIFDHLDINPTYFLISNDDKTAYISMNNYILKIDINSKIRIKLVLTEGSSIADMVLYNNTLYASNMGLDRMELINIQTNNAYHHILTSKSEPTRLSITDDNTKLLVANRCRDDYGGIDIIDLKSNSLISTILMNAINSQPYDVISLNVPYTYIPPVDMQRRNQLITIIAKRIFAYYNEKFDFPFININLTKQINCSYVLKEIKFEPGIIVPSSEVMSCLSITSGLSSIKLIARVNYLVDYLENNKDISIKGFFEMPIEIIVDIPPKRKLEEFQSYLKTITKFTVAPSILYNVISFGVITNAELTVVGEDKIYLSNSKDSHGEVGENFQEIAATYGSIFPNDVFSL